MSLRTALLLVKDTVFNIKNPSNLDITPHQLTIRTRTWLGGKVDAPVASGPQYIDSDLVLQQKYKVRQMTTREMNESGGRYEMGDMLVKGIIPADPANPGVGYYPTQLAPAAQQGQEVFYILVGPHNGHYSLKELRSYKMLSYDLILDRRRTAPIVVSPDVVAGETPPDGM